MTITLCGSIKFFDQMSELKTELEKLGFDVLMPIKVPGLDYWAADGTERIEAKKGLNLLETHMDKITKSDAILVANYTKGDIENYIGANTFLEMGYAKYMGKKIYTLNPLPTQPYIHDELVSFGAVVISGDLSLIPRS